MNITNLSVSVADNRSKARPYLSKMQAISARLNRLYYTGKMMNNVGCCLSAGGQHFLDQQESFKQRKILFEFLELHNESGKVREALKKKLRILRHRSKRWVGTCFKT